MTQMIPDPITGVVGPDPMLRGLGDIFRRKMGIPWDPSKPYPGLGPGNNPLQVFDRDRYAGTPQQPPQQNPWQQPPRQQPTGAQPTAGIQSGLPLGVMANISQMPGRMTEFGETIGGFGEQMGGFGETLGGYKDLLSGFGEKFGGFGEQLGGFKDEFSGINDKLQNLEQGISSLTDKFGTQQQQQSPYQQNFGMNPFGSINPYTPFFGGLGAFMRRY